METMLSPQKTRHTIKALIDELPAESLPTVETFIRFVQAQQAEATPAAESRPPWRYPTVPVPAESLDRLVGIMPDVEGDALRDTEAVYDEG